MIVHPTQNNHADEGSLYNTILKAGYGQLIPVKVLTWNGRTPDRVQTRWGAIFTQNAQGFYEPDRGSGKNQFVPIQADLSNTDKLESNKSSETRKPFKIDTSRISNLVEEPFGLFAQYFSK